jgi:hypothetical protein
VNYVKAYLDGMTNAQVIELQKDTKRALEDLEDTNRSMAVYRDGDDLLERVCLSCFTPSPLGLLSRNAYKAVDEKTRLHATLAFPNLYHIPVGFYYAKWLEKLDYYLRTNPSRERSVSIASSSAAAPSAERLALEEKRAAILDDRADTKLSIKDKAVFDYREERRLQYYQHGRGMDEDEVAFNTQYDAEQFVLVQKLLEKGDDNDNEGHGSAEQGQR